MGFEELIKKLIIDAFEEAVHKILEKLKFEVYPNVMNVKQASKYLNVSEKWLRLNLDSIPHYEMAGHKFNKEDLDDLRLSKTGRSFKVVRRDKT